MISTTNDFLVDLNDALKLEPMNDAVKQDLKKVEGLLSKGTAKQATVSILFVS